MDRILPWSIQHRACDDGHEHPQNPEALQVLQEEVEEAIRTMKGGHSVVWRVSWCRTSLFGHVMLMVHVMHQGNTQEGVAYLLLRMVEGRSAVLPTHSIFHAYHILSKFLPVFRSQCVMILLIVDVVMCCS